MFVFPCGYLIADNGVVPKTSRKLTPVTDSFRASNLRRFGVGLVAAKFVLVPMAFDPGAMNPFAVPKAIVGQTIGVLLVGVMVALLLRFGRTPWRTTPVHLAVATLIATYLIASAFALNRVVAILGSPDDAVGLATVLDGAVLFLGLATLVSTRLESRVLAAALFVPLIPIVAYELLQRAGGDPVAWTSDIGTVRPFSTFGNADVLAHYVGTLGVAAGALLILHRWTRCDATFLAAVCVVALAGTLLTATRAVVPGLMFAGIVVAGFALRRRATTNIRRPLLILSVVTLIVLPAVALSPIGQRFVGFASSMSRIQEGGPVEGSIGGRLVLYEAAFAQISGRPILGVGPGNFVVAYPATRSERAYEFLQTTAIENSPHNWLLKVGTDAGILGLGVFAATLIAAVVVATSRRASSVVAIPALVAIVYLLGAGLFTVNDAGTEWLLWASLGVIAAVPRPTSDTGPKLVAAPRASRHSRPWVLLIPVVLGVAALPMAAAAIEGERAGGENRRSRLAGAVPQSVAAGERAVSRVSYRAEYWHGLGLSLAARADYGRAERAFARAVELAPYHTTYVANLARAQASLGRQGDSDMFARAVGTAHVAVVQDPRNIESYVALAIVAQAAGRSIDSVAAAESALRIGPEPTDINFYAAAADAYFSMARMDQAERLLRLGLGRSPNVTAGRSLHLQLARVLAQTERRAEALAEVDKVLAALPTDRAAQELRQRILAQ